MPTDNEQEDFRGTLLKLGEVAALRPSPNELAKFAEFILAYDDFDARLVVVDALEASTLLHFDDYKTLCDMMEICPRHRVDASICADDQADCDEGTAAAVRAADRKF